MIYLLLSIISSTLIGLIFKGYEYYKIDNFQAIVFNYFICVICVTLTLGHSPATPDFWVEDWFPYALVLGAIFISAFNIIAITIQKFGVTIGAIMQKMSILISVTFAIFYYNESVTFFKIVGILLAIAAIILTNLPDRTKAKLDLPTHLWFFPAIVLITAGVGEIILQYVETNLTSGTGNLQFVGFLFGTAGLLGLVVLIGQLILGKTTIKIKNIIAGIALGIPNFGSIYFLMKSLGMGWEGSVVFPINNVAIIVLSAFVAVLFLKESLTKLNWLGVGLAALSILLITLG